MTIFNSSTTTHQKHQYLTYSEWKEWIHKRQEIYMSAQQKKYTTQNTETIRFQTIQPKNPAQQAPI